jgi:O-antigen ligase
MASAMSSMNHLQHAFFPQAEPSRSPDREPASRALLVAMFLYAVSLIKFFVRDPLVAQTGPQGPIELALVALSCIAILATFRRRYWKLSWTTSAKAFVAFGAIAALSSTFSYYPLLSFLKGLSFIVVCGIAIAASSAFRPAQILKYLYYSIVILLVMGFLFRIAGPCPLLDIDDFSGRARFTMFAWHPGTLADLSALALLSGLLLPKRPPLCFPLFLFAINIASASRASSALLVAILLMIGLVRARLTVRFLFLCCCLGSVLTIAMLVAAQKYRQPAEIASIGQSLYGDKFDEDLATLDGRREVWSNAAPLLSHCAILGYGLDGARDVLINSSSWPAGNSHNSLIDLILSGGFPATLLFLLGWAAAVRRALLSRGFARTATLGLYAYIAGFGLVSPNLTYLQGLASFLILTADAMARTEFTLVAKTWWKQFQCIHRNAPATPEVGASA